MLQYHRQAKTKHLLESRLGNLIRWACPPWLISSKVKVKIKVSALCTVTEERIVWDYIIDFYINFDVSSDTSSTRLSKSGSWWSLGGFQSHGQIKAAIVGKLEVVATLWNPAPSQCQGGEIQIKYNYKYKWLWEIHNLKILNLKITCLPVF